MAESQSAENTMSGAEAACAAGPSNAKPVNAGPSDLSKEQFAKFEKCLLFNMVRLKPSGINKHLNVLLLQEAIREQTNINVSTENIWKYLETLWDIKAADAIENADLTLAEGDFSLPEEYDSLIAEERRKIKQRFREDLKRRNIFVGPKSRAPGYKSSDIVKPSSDSSTGNASKETHNELKKKKVYAGPKSRAPGYKSSDIVKPSSDSSTGNASKETHNELKKKKVYAGPKSRAPASSKSSDIVNPSHDSKRGHSGTASKKTRNEPKKNKIFTGPKSRAPGYKSSDIVKSVVDSTDGLTEIVKKETRANTRKSPFTSDVSNKKNELENKEMNKIIPKVGATKRKLKK